MLDNALIALFASTLEAASAAAGWNYVVIQNNQPSQEGVPTAPTIFFEKLFDTEYGWPSSSKYVLGTVTPPGHELPDFTVTDEQWVETTFQVTALVIQDPNNLTLPTPADVANYLKLYLNNRIVMRGLQSQGVSILRVTQVRNPKFSDDRGLFEANPNFDVVLQHIRTLALTVGASDTVQGVLYPVKP